VVEQDPLSTSGGRASERAWTPVGGGLGVAVGASALTVAWVMTLVREGVGSEFGVSDQVASRAIAVMVLLAIVVLTLIPTLRSRTPGRAVCSVWIIAVASGAMMAIRMLSHEMAIDVESPARGGTDAIVHVVGRVMERLTPVEASRFGGGQATSGLIERARWRTELDVEASDHPASESWGA
jgi:hypothetical protein